MGAVYQFSMPTPDPYGTSRLVWYQRGDVVEVHVNGRIFARMPFAEFREQWEQMVAYRASRSPELWAETEARNVPDIEKLTGGKQ